jgi:hypothetical protein
MVDDRKNNAEGKAALSMFESLLIAMCDLDVMSEEEIRKVLIAAAATHHGVGQISRDPALDKEVAEVIEQIMIGQSPTRGFW